MHDFATFETYDFAFRCPDEEGVMCRYDALLSFSFEEAGPIYLVYTDLVCDEAGEEAMYASVVVDPEQVRAAQYAVEHGMTPKKPPVVDLVDIEEDLKPMVLEVLDEVLADEEG